MSSVEVGLFHGGESRMNRGMLPICDPSRFATSPSTGKLVGVNVQNTCKKKLGKSDLSDLTVFRPPMFPVGGTMRWKTKNAIFLRETRTFTGNVIVSRGADILIRLEIE